MDWPSLKAPQLLRALKRKPLSYRVVNQTGSHRKLESPNGYPPLEFSYHDKRTIPPSKVKKILVDDVGLPESEARKLI